MQLLGHRAGELGYKHQTTSRCASYELGAWVADLVQPEWFLTFTWADPRGQGSYTHRGVSFVDASIARWTKAFDPAAMWSGMEAHKFRTTPHVHSVARGFSPELVAESCHCEVLPRRLHMPIWCQTKTAFGRFQMEPVRSRADAATYVGKYINKGLGKIFVSGGGILAAPVVPDPREYELWAAAVRNGELAELDRQDERLRYELAAANRDLERVQRRLRDRQSRLLA